MKSIRLRTFYNPRMSLDSEELTGYTQTPAKPKLMMDFIERKGLSEYFLVDEDLIVFHKVCLG